MKYRIKKVYEEDVNYYPYTFIHYHIQVKVNYLFFFKKWVTIKTFSTSFDYELGDYDAEQEAWRVLQELEK